MICDICAKYTASPPQIMRAEDASILMPSSPGVYFVWRDDKVKYVGQSICLRRRLMGTRHEAVIKGDMLSWLYFPEARLNYAEAFYIGALCPERNFGRAPKKQMYSYAAYRDKYLRP